LQAVDEHITFAERQDETGGDDKFLTPIYKGIGSESIKVYLIRYKGSPEQGRWRSIVEKGFLSIPVVVSLGASKGG
jgi:hypothetical protein